MANLKRSNSKIQQFYSKIIIIILFIFVLFAGNTTWNLYQKYREAKFNRDIAQSELEKLQKREKNLLSELNKLNTERGIEGELRKKFGIVKDGEEVVVIVEPTGNNSTKNGDVKKNKKGFFQKVLSLFKN